MLDVTVIEDPEAAAVSLDPIRARLLAELAGAPASAAMLAGRVGLPRQKVNYHLKALERHGLVELAGERRKGNVTERLMRATAASYVISPAALPAVQPDPDRFRDQLSARWLLALGARLVRDVGMLISGAAKARKRLATYALDGEVRFASAADRAAFVQELTAGVSALIRKYDAPDAEAGRDHRIVVAVHPTVKDQPRPAVGDGTRPAADGGTRSAADGETRSAVAGETRHAAEDETRPAAAGESRPADKDGPRSAVEDQSALGS
ncbi:helix-turn-helix domain-containing protein [Streptomyces sp. GbtcB6]|uniref:ArsR/SmtB family transcription factor n=1 Tax=Streptomyces sp. GbtcB6 TaxID=2824751 RepID=UPI0027E468BB|nr:helix-turn-helix domain-containing protein [Streptomyces sp. GbtcB6]